MGTAFRCSQERNIPLVIRYTFVNTPRLRLNSQFAVLFIKSVNCLILQSLDNLASHGRTNW